MMAGEARKAAAAAVEDDSSIGSELIAGVLENLNTDSLNTPAKLPGSGKASTPRLSSK